MVRLLLCLVHVLLWYMHLSLISVNLSQTRDTWLMRWFGAWWPLRWRTWTASSLGRSPTICSRTDVSRTRAWTCLRSTYREVTSLVLVLLSEEFSLPKGVFRRVSKPLIGSGSTCLLQLQLQLSIKYLERRTLESCSISVYTLVTWASIKQPSFGWTLSCNNWLGATLTRFACPSCLGLWPHALTIIYGTSDLRLMFTYLISRRYSWRNTIKELSLKLAFVFWLKRAK